ncbi:MAG: PD40 domain-containing protein [Planctomycetes bacterium]|nr:PD40 domain-containing protein [Planctomycetota bacterium]MBI3847979.1 PD40 domain-containing protein [Planctomycetota bacterium]
MRNRIARILVACTSIITFSGVASAQTLRVSLDSSGHEGHAQSSSCVVSSDGRFVAFHSDATDLVPGDANGRTDVFERDLETGVTVRVSVTSAGVESDGNSTSPVISADGRFVAFFSLARNFGPSNPNPNRLLYVHDRDTGATEWASVTSLNVATDDVRSPSISGDGRFIAFEGGYILPNHQNSNSDVYVRDRVAGTTRCASLLATGDYGGGVYPSISENGRYVAFVSGSNLDPTPATGSVHVYIRDLQTDTARRVSLDSAGNGADNGSSYPAISGSGRYVAFISSARNLVPGDTNNQEDLFVRDVVAGTTVRINVDPAGNQSSATQPPAISADGRFVAFTSGAPNLVVGDTNTTVDVFVRDLQTNVTTRVSLNWLGGQANGSSVFGAISGDGSVVGFQSGFSTAVPNDVNGTTDVFVHIRENVRCSSGNVNLGLGGLASVLSVNGSTGDALRQVTTGVGSPITVNLNAAPHGPASPRYVVWVWAGPPSRSLQLLVDGFTFGCTVEATPFMPFGFPQPLRCLRGGLSPLVCIGVTELPSPARAPWTVTKPGGFGAPATFTVQGMIEDSGSANAFPFSITNAVVLRVQ